MLAPDITGQYGSISPRPLYFSFIMVMLTDSIPLITRQSGLELTDLEQCQLNLMFGVRSLMTMGYTYWDVSPAGDLVRVTNQLRLPDLINIPDGSDQYVELMTRMQQIEDRYEGRIYACLWFYCYDPIDYHLTFRYYPRLLS